MTSEADMKKSKTSMAIVKSQGSMKSMTTFGAKSMSRLKVRKGSYGYGAVPGIRPVERTSQLGIEFKRPPLLYLNTYQLEPKPRFHLANVKFVIEEMLDEHFTGHKYNVQVSTNLTIRLANDLMRKIKTMGFNRYRIITIVTIGQKRAQSYSNSIAFVWDYERDAYVNTQRELAIVFKRPQLIFSPTYQLDPHEFFDLENVTKVVEEMIDNNFSGHKYHSQESPALALRMAGALMRKVKAMDFNRYRLISVVTIGQKRAQSFNNAISFLWDHERDNYVEAQRETATAFLQVTLFAVYFD